MFSINISSLIWEFGVYKKIEFWLRVFLRSPELDGSSARPHGIWPGARVLYHSMCVVRHGHRWDDSPHPTHAMAGNSIGRNQLMKWFEMWSTVLAAACNLMFPGWALQHHCWGYWSQLCILAKVLIILIRASSAMPNPPCHTPTVVWTDISRETGAEWKSCRCVACRLSIMGCCCLGCSHLREDGRVAWNSYGTYIIQMWFSAKLLQNWVSANWCLGRLVILSFVALPPLFHHLQRTCGAIGDGFLLRLSYLLWDEIDSTAHNVQAIIRKGNTFASTVQLTCTTARNLHKGKRQLSWWKRSM